MEWTFGVGWARRATTAALERRLAAGAVCALRADTLSALRVGVVVLDRDDRPLLTNSAATALGLVRQGGSAGPQVHAVIRTLAAQVRRGGVRREVELDLPRTGTRGDPAGEQVGVRVSAIPLAGAGYPSGCVAVEAADVTEAHRVARVRRDFVANVSHELMTPVGALSLLAETLLEAADDPVAARRFAERIHHESLRLGRLVMELLELSRLQGADPLPAPVPVSADRLFTEVVDRARTAAAAKAITLATTGTAGLTVYGDERQLITAVANLVENAVAYSPDQTTVTIDIRRSGDEVRVAVVDQGIGIEAKDLDRIFERFYRADQARSRDTGGTGLGLAIVRHIALNHGGRVEVTSAVGSGSTFTLVLPASPRRGPAGRPAPDLDED